MHLTTLKFGAVKEVLDSYQAVRNQTVSFCENLKTEDYNLQAIDDTSPAKWHLAHTTWFFEEMILNRFKAGYRKFHPKYEYLFNSYYEGVGEFWHRPSRGQLSRPPVEDVLKYRRYVDEHIHQLLTNIQKSQREEVFQLIAVGVHHEQQHQELLLMDIKYNFGFQPFQPALFPNADIPESQSEPLAFTSFEDGPVTIGTSEQTFAYDNERPAHNFFSHAFRLANRLINCREYLSFIEDGGYDDYRYWLSDGWEWVKQNAVKHPLYWHFQDDEWWIYTLAGVKALDPDAPVSHISYYEADAYARWAGYRLPTEQEWERASLTKAFSGWQADQVPAGKFVDEEVYEPYASPSSSEGQAADMAGNVWEWTSSNYLPYPNFQPFQGKLEEYNGKFMSGQMVLRGGSCLTPASHIRPTYRNFFQPGKRWPCTGIRLASDVQNGHLRPTRHVEENIRFIDHHPRLGKMIDEVTDSLSQPYKTLSPKYFYDSRGSELFEQICELPEYYPTRTEIGILEENIDALHELMGSPVNLIEFGAGAVRKIQILVRGYEDEIVYVPIDIAGQFLLESSRNLRTVFPDLRIVAICADYTNNLKAIIEQAFPDNQRRNVVFFPGSTLGNFDPAEAREFLTNVHQALRPGDGMVVGMDLKKDKQVMEAAYDDAAGVTAAFNKNILAHINRETGSNFDLGNFEHKSFFNDQKSRIEMHLCSKISQSVTIGDTTIQFREGECIHTENSHKHSQEALEAMFGEAGFTVGRFFTDSQQKFGVFYLEA